MTAKSKKDLQNENSELKQKLNMVTNKLEKLSEENKSLKTELIQERERRNNRCNNCEKSPGKDRNLKKHVNDKRSTVGLSKCDQCTKMFNEEWKLNAHKVRSMKELSRI